MGKWLFFIFVYCISVCSLYAQEDSAKVRGTIKIAKQKITKPRVYIAADANFANFDRTKKKFSGPITEIFQPFPVVAGHAFPFNYTGFFNEKFRDIPIDLGEKETDTVTLEVTVMANGKVSVRDRSKVLYVKGVAVFYNQEADGYEINNLHLNCLESLKSIAEWIPAYAIIAKKDKYKNTTVIKPNKEKYDAQGIVKVYFSKTPFDY